MQERPDFLPKQLFSKLALANKSANISSFYLFILIQLMNNHDSAVLQVGAFLAFAERLLIHLQGILRSDAANLFNNIRTLSKSKLSHHQVCTCVLFILLSNSLC